jgi:hypothetical protein
MSPAKHLPLEKFEPVDMPLRSARVTPPDSEADRELPAFLACVLLPPMAHSSKRHASVMVL